MKEIEYWTIDLDKWEEGKKTVGRDVIQYSDDEVRDNDLCTSCKNIGYPACKEVCQGYEFMLKQLAKDQQ